ncbi:hypothetical protein LCGC14_2971230 [marine sediment metagenome]|uniref:Uncharacterized protein n=1 Tax=marine sediment metagenome TaxID=412755 RepID=A0A0F8XA86_9ZZZZ
MAKMRAISMNRWGTNGIQVTYEVSAPVDGLSTNFSEAAMPENSSEFARLLAIRMYDEFDVDLKKVATP